MLGRSIYSSGRKAELNARWLTAIVGRVRPRGFELRGETITTLHVVDPVEGVESDYGGGGYYDAQAHERAVERGEELGELARDRADDASILETTVLETAVETGPPARLILEYVDENDVDHVVMGSHGRSGVARILLGSVRKSSRFSSQSERKAF